MKIEEVSEKHIGMKTMLISHIDGQKPIYNYGILCRNSCGDFYYKPDFEKGKIFASIIVTHVLVTT